MGTHYLSELNFYVIIFIILRGKFIQENSDSVFVELGTVCSDGGVQTLRRELLPPSSGWKRVTLEKCREQKLPAMIFILAVNHNFNFGWVCGVLMVWEPWVYSALLLPVQTHFILWSSLRVYVYCSPYTFILRTMQDSSLSEIQRGFFYFSTRSLNLTL
jgi:hypothetical protein